MSTLSALKALVAADNCNYEASTMRYAGLFQDAKQAIAEEESLISELLEVADMLDDLLCLLDGHNRPDVIEKKTRQYGAKARAAISKAKGVLKP